MRRLLESGLPELKRIAAALLLGGLCTALPASAETLDQLDALADAAMTEEGGIALARTQAQRGDYLEALSSLERVLGAFPLSPTALIEHAAYLCAVDDRQGGRVELLALREQDYSARAWSDAQANCADLAPVIATPLAPTPPSSNRTSQSTSPRPNARPDPKVN